MSAIKQNIVMFSDLLLPPSMTFVRSQGEALEHFKAFYLGSRKTHRNGLELPADRTMILNSAASKLGKLREIPLKLFNYDPTVAMWLSRVRPALIHAHFGTGGVTMLPLARRLRLPLLVTFHGFDATVNNKYALRSTFTHRRFIRKRADLQEGANAFIAVSEFILRKLIEQSYPADKIIRIYIGVDTEWFRPDEQIVREPIVLFVGNLVESKGCEFVIRAMQQVQQSLPLAELVVIGDGPLRDCLEAEAREKLRRYRFLGFQSPVVVKAWMNRAQVFCVPSVEVETGASEGFGIVFAEAQSMGVPVASFVTGGIPEAVAHGETGLLAPPRDYRKLAANIHALLTDHKVRAEMSHAGRERTRKKFNLRSQTKKLECVYQAAIEDERRAKNRTTR